jgi:hypothetical protein
MQNKNVTKKMKKKTRKQPQKRKQKRDKHIIQDVKVNVNSSGGSSAGGSTSSIPTVPHYSAPPFFQLPQAYKDTRGEDVINQKLSDIASILSSYQHETSENPSIGKASSKEPADPHKKGTKKVSSHDGQSLDDPAWDVASAGLRRHSLDDQQLVVKKPTPTPKKIPYRSMLEQNTNLPFFSFGKNSIFDREPEAMSLSQVAQSTKPLESTEVTRIEVLKSDEERRQQTQKARDAKQAKREAKIQQQEEERLRKIQEAQAQAEAEAEASANGKKKKKSKNKQTIDV